MKKNKKSPKAPDADKIAALFGIDVEVASEKVQTFKTPESLNLEADAVIDYIYNPAGWVDKKCRCCGKKFATNYRFVSVCSLTCRKEELDAVGLRWDPTRSEEQRWIALKIEPPGIVPPIAYVAIQELLRRYSDDFLKDPAESIL